MNGNPTRRQVAGYLLIAIIVGLTGLLHTIHAGPAAGASSAPLPAAERMQPDGTTSETIAPEDLWNAVAGLAPGSQFGAPAGRWWPRLPEFDVPPYRGEGLPLPGQRFTVTQSYADIDAPGAGLELALTLFTDPTAASEAFAALADISDVGGVPGVAPAVGEEARAFTRTLSDNGVPVDEATIRFRVGPVVARVSWFAVSGLEPEDPAPEAINGLAATVADRLGALFAGGLGGSALAPELAALLPPAVPGIGPVLAQVAIPPEAWATMDTTNDPETITSLLRNGGVRQLAFQRLALAADADQVVEVILFPFADASSSWSFLTGYLIAIAADPTSRLDPGATGDASGFAFHDDNYELQFVAGPYLADVSCLAPFGEVSPVCEDAVRQLGSAWFAMLQRILAQSGG